MVSLQEASGADIVCTSTPVRSPVVKREWVKAGAHINAMGADAPGKQELDVRILQEARIYRRRGAGAALGRGERAAARRSAEEGADRGDAGRGGGGEEEGAPGDEITIFDSTGLALQDVAWPSALRGGAHPGRGPDVRSGGQRVVRALSPVSSTTRHRVCRHLVPVVVVRRRSTTGPRSPRPSLARWTRALALRSAWQSPERSARPTSARARMRASTRVARWRGPSTGCCSAERAAHHEVAPIGRHRVARHLGAHAERLESLAETFSSAKKSLPLSSTTMKAGNTGFSTRSALPPAAAANRTMRRRDRGRATQSRRWRQCHAAAVRRPAAYRPRCNAALPASRSSAGATGTTPFSSAASAASSGVSEVGKRWCEVMARLCPKLDRK